jgi:predicted O-methyltransferase YrrM
LNKIRSFLPVYLYLIGQLPKTLLVRPGSFYGRATIRAIVSLLGWKNPCDQIKNLAPTRALGEVVPAQTVRILHPLAHLGDVSTYELVVLNSLVKAFKPKNIFEIGTLHGRTTVNLLENAEQLEVLYTLDILEELPVNRFSTHPRAAKVKRIVVDSRQLDVGPFAGEMDFIFIDADHTYDAVVNDSRKAMEMLSPGGCVVWHDYTMMPDTKQACHQFMGKHPGRRFVQIEDTTLLVMLPVGA